MLFSLCLIIIDGTLLIRFTAYKTESGRRILRRETKDSGGKILPTWVETTNGIFS